MIFEAAVAMLRALLRALAPLAPAGPPAQPPPAAAAPPIMSAQAQATAVIELADYLLVSSDGWVMQSPFRESDVCDMRLDGLSGFWIWTNTGARTIDDLIEHGGLNGIAVDYFAPAYMGSMIGVQRNVDSGNLYAYTNVNSSLSVGADFPPNTMPLAMTLPVLQPSQMATTIVTPGAVQAFPWEPAHRYQLAPENCAVLADDGVMYTRNSVYLVADLPIGGTVGTPPLTLILETEGTAGDPANGMMRLERYAFVPGFGRVWQEQAWDPRTPDANGVRSIWNIKVPNDRGHLVGPLCPIQVSSPSV